MSIIVDWNGSELPEQLKELPAERYVIEPVDEVPSLTEEQDEGLRQAMRSIASGSGVPADVARARLEARTRK